MTPAMFTPSRELREYMARRLDMAVRARTNYASVERLELELAGMFRHDHRADPYTQDDAVKAIQQWVDKHGGRPGWKAWRRTRGRPSYETILRMFGSWNSALRAAGIPVADYGRATSTHCANGHRWSRDTEYWRPCGRKRQCRACQRDSRARSETRRAA